MDKIGGGTMGEGTKRTDIPERCYTYALFSTELSYTLIRKKVRRLRGKVLWRVSKRSKGGVYGEWVQELR